VVYIHIAETDDYRDKVGLDYDGYTVIVPWRQGFKFICYGTCRIGLVMEARNVEASEDAGKAGGTEVIG